MAQVFLIGGSSHVGKSTFAADLAQRVGGELLATDALARHPGRPWPGVRPHVAEHYRRLSAAAIDAFLLDHHVNMWPGLRALILARTGEDASVPLVLEGSALRPELVAEIDASGVSALWLTLAPELIAARIEQGSDYGALDADRRLLVDAFSARSVRDNARVLEAIEQTGACGLDAADEAARAAWLAHPPAGRGLRSRTETSR